MRGGQPQALARSVAVVSTGNAESLWHGQFMTDSGLEAWETMDDLENTLLDPEEGNGRVPISAAHQAPRKPIEKRQRKITLCVAMFVVAIFCYTGFRLSQLGFFSGNGDDPSVPLVANGTAMDKATGISFDLSTTPPGMNNTFDLLGMSTRLSKDDTRLCIVGLYTERKSQRIDEWKKMAGQRNYENLFQELLNDYHPLSLRIIMMNAIDGEDVSGRWGQDLKTFLHKQHPFDHFIIQRELDEFQRWFPDRFDRGDVLWLTWDHQWTIFSVNGAVVESSGDRHIGHAVFENELSFHGTGLVNLLYKAP